MLNYLWGIMILLGITVSALTGRLPHVTNASIESARDAVNVIIQMAGIVTMWTGLMKVAEKAGLIDSIAQRMTPILTFLFPDVPKKSPALNYISTNLIANMLGLGWAATPAGIMAMKELQKINKNKKVASRSMCMFLIINMSSLQIIAVTVIGDRAAYGSVAPAEVIAPAIIVTAVTSVVGVVVGKVFGWGDQDR